MNSTDLLGIANEMEELASAAGEQSISTAAREWGRKIEQNRFHLVVVGQFKRGKTSVLNALLGDEVLPVSVLPLTSVVTLLRYGERPSAVAHLASGGETTLRVDDLAEYVTESGNPRNIKGVNYVEVYYPSAYLRYGVTLIDTPGIASVHVHNTQVAYDFLPRIDAAIFVTSPEPPLTSAEIEFLADLREQVGRIFVVMNKADLPEAVHLEQVLAFTRESLPAGLSPSPIFTVSAQRALEAKRTGNAALLEASGFRPLEFELGRFLRDEKAGVLARSTAAKLLRLTGEFRMLLQLRIEAARMPVEQLRGKIAEFEQQIRRARQQQEDNELLLKGGLAKLSTEFGNAAKSFAETQVPAMREAIAEFAGQSLALSRRRFAREMERFIAGQVSEAFDGWRREFEASAVARFRETTARFERQTNELARQVRTTAGNLFGIEIANFEAREELEYLEPSGYRTEPLLFWGSAICRCCCLAACIAAICLVRRRRASPRNWSAMRPAWRTTSTKGWATAFRRFSDP